MTTSEEDEREQASSSMSVALNNLRLISTTKPSYQTYPSSRRLLLERHKSLHYETSRCGCEREALIPALNHTTTTDQYAADLREPRPGQWVLAYRCTDMTTA
jgi:short-subunit dehydrogenase